MDYFRCLLPKSYPSAPPASPSTSFNTTRGTSSDLFAPPHNADNEAESQPFVPYLDGHTTLDQTKRCAPPGDVMESSYLYKRRSTSILRACSDAGPQSELSIPARSNSHISNGPRRRSSVPSSILRSRASAGNCMDEKQQCVRFLLATIDRSFPAGMKDYGSKPVHECSEGVESETKALINVMEEALPQTTYLGTNQVQHDQQTNKPESLTDMAESRVRVHEGNDVMSGNAAREAIEVIPKSLSIANRWTQINFIQSPGTISIPRDTRLCQSTQDYGSSHEQMIKGRGRTLWVGQTAKTCSSADGVSEDQLNNLPKTSAASSVMTHAYVHNFLPGEISSLQGPTEECLRKFSNTYEVVCSSDSAYEVIWEDSMQATLSTDEPISAHTSRSSSASPNSVQHHAHSLTEFDTSKTLLDHVTTELRSWSWQSKAASYDGRRLHNGQRKGAAGQTDALPKQHEQRFGFDTISSQSAIASSSRKADLERHAMKKPLMRAPLETEFQDESEHKQEAEVDDIINRRRSSSSSPPTLMASPGPNSANLLTPPPINARTRQELLGNRKLSNFPDEGEHFALHRDSLILAHDRIFHENDGAKTAQDRLDHGTASRIKQLKTSTWKRQVPKTSPGDAVDSADP